MIISFHNIQVIKRPTENSMTYHCQIPLKKKNKIIFDLSEKEFNYMVEEGIIVVEEDSIV